MSAQAAKSTPCCEGPADDLVDRVVAADVLARDQQTAAHATSAAACKTAGGREARLLRAQHLRQREQPPRRHARVRGAGHRPGVGHEIVEPLAPAGAAGRDRGHRARREPGRVEIDVDRVRTGRHQRAGLALGVQEAAHQLEVVAGGAQDRRHHRAASPDLERRLLGDRVVRLDHVAARAQATDQTQRVGGRHREKVARDRPSRQRQQ
jgi:hypothetical protein